MIIMIIEIIMKIIVIVVTWCYSYYYPRYLKDFSKSHGKPVAKLMDAPHIKNLSWPSSVSNITNHPLLVFRLTHRVAHFLPEVILHSGKIFGQLFDNFRNSAIYILFFVLHESWIIAVGPHRKILKMGKWRKWKIYF